MTDTRELFVFAFFASTVTDYFGDDLDPTELSDHLAELNTTDPDLPRPRSESPVRSGRLGGDVLGPGRFACVRMAEMGR